MNALMHGLERPASTPQLGCVNVSKSELGFVSYEMLVRIGTYVFETSGALVQNMDDMCRTTVLRPLH